MSSTSATAILYHCPACGHVERSRRTWTWRGIVLDEGACTIARDGVIVRLQPKQATILASFMRRPDMPYPAETLADLADILTIESLRSTISRLRHLIRPLGLVIEDARWGVKRTYRLSETR